jgi:hypothetical protein
MWKFFGQNWGNTASVIGLLFSFLAFVFSKRASKAAREARELTLSRSLGEDVNNASKIASDVAAYVRSEKAEMALVRLGELISLTSYIISRWEAHLSMPSRNRLITAREQLHVLHDVLDRVKGGPINAKDKATFARFCREVPTVFIEEYGRAIRGMDRRE